MNLERYRTEQEAAWRELECLLEKVERRGIQVLNGEEIEDLGEIRGHYTYFL